MGPRKPLTALLSGVLGREMQELNCVGLEEPVDGRHFRGLGLLAWVRGMPLQDCEISEQVLSVVVIVAVGIAGRFLVPVATSI
jgi:hypothetical protein